MKCARKLIELFALLLAINLSAGCVSTNKLPEASAGFVPRTTYAVDYETAWSKMLAALSANSIAVASSSKENGQISSDYMEGSHVAVIPIATTDSRYKFNIFISKTAEKQTAVNIKPVLEASTSGDRGSTPFHDVTSENAKLATKVRDWLYEKFEQKLAGA